MPKNQILENITIDKLIFGGKGLGLAPDGRKVIITGGCTPGSVVNVRVLKERKSHYEGQELDVVQKSPLEVPLLPGHQLYGGAKWLTIGYEHQLEIKDGQVKEAFHHILKYLAEQNPREPSLSQGGNETGNHLTIFHPIIPSPEIYGYRNKVEFSWGKYISDREGIHDDFRFGFHAQGQFDRIVDCEYCALATDEVNDIFRTIDTLSRASGFPTYDPKTQVGFWRHLVVRSTKKTGETMLIFSVNATWDDTQRSIEGSVEYFFTDMVRQLSEKYTSLHSIYFLENTGKADIVTGNEILLAGKATIEEELLGKRFEIAPKSFFQVNTLGAEKLYTRAIDMIENKGGTLLDLYAGTGTIGILLAEHFREVYSVELVQSASRDGERNATKNGITNVRFVNAKVEDFVRKIGSEYTIDQGELTIILDPPRDGMHPSALPHILAFGAREIIYVSCNPATLARDLEIFAGKTRDEKTLSLPRYRITDITPVDMFPHTHHIETVVRLELI